MSTEENKNVIRRMEAAINRKDLAEILKLHTPNVVGHNDRVRGHEELRQLCEALWTTWASLHVTIEDLIAEGDKVVERWTFTAIHQGEFEGIAATGKQVVYSGIHIYRIENGKIAESWSQADTLGVAQQLGAVLKSG